jgi:hypothetical protein
MELVAGAFVIVHFGWSGLELVAGGFVVLHFASSPSSTSSPSSPSSPTTTTTTTMPLEAVQNAVTIMELVAGGFVVNALAITVGKAERVVKVAKVQENMN